MENQVNSLILMINAVGKPETVEAETLPRPDPEPPLAAFPLLSDWKTARKRGEADE